MKAYFLCVAMVFGVATVSAAVPFKNTKFQGMHVSESDAKSSFGEIGLKAGDVVIAFDGQAVTSPADAMKFYQNLKDGKLTKLLIKRGDHFEMLTKAESK